MSRLRRISRLPELEGGNFSQLCQFSRMKDRAATRPKKTQVALPIETSTDRDRERDRDKHRQRQRERQRETESYVM